MKVHPDTGAGPEPMLTVSKPAAPEEPPQCGWLKDRFGISWQIVPAALGRILGDPDPEHARRATEAMLRMKKLDVAELERAAEGVGAAG